ncbi:hypothetical protein ACFLXC_07130 [Chloroflexota bacterium]
MFTPVSIHEQITLSITDTETCRKLLIEADKFCERETIHDRLKIIARVLPTETY